MPSDETAASEPYRHPVGRCQSIQCAACFDLIGPGPVERPGYCHHGHPRRECYDCKEANRG